MNIFTNKKPLKNFALSIFGILTLTIASVFFLVNNQEKNWSVKLEESKEKWNLSIDERINFLSSEIGILAQDPDTLQIKFDSPTFSKLYKRLSIWFSQLSITSSDSKQTNIIGKNIPTELLHTVHILSSNNPSVKLFISNNDIYLYQRSTFNKGSIIIAKINQDFLWQAHEDLPNKAIGCVMNHSNLPVQCVNSLNQPINIGFDFSNLSYKKYINTNNVTYMQSSENNTLKNQLLSNSKWNLKTLVSYSNIIEPIKTILVIIALLLLLFLSLSYKIYKKSKRITKTIYSILNKSPFSSTYIDNKDIDDIDIATKLLKENISEQNKTIQLIDDIDQANVNVDDIEDLISQFLHKLKNSSLQNFVGILYEINNEPILSFIDEFNDINHKKNKLKCFKENKS